MIRLVGGAAGEPEYVVATGVCLECGEAIERWMTPLEVDGTVYPPVYTWKHKSDGVVVCGIDGERFQIAKPVPGSVVE